MIQDSVFGLSNGHRLHKLTPQGKSIWFQENLECTSLRFYFSNLYCQQSDSLVSLTNQHGITNWKIPFDQDLMHIKYPYVVAIKDRRLSVYGLDTGSIIWSGKLRFYPFDFSLQANADAVVLGKTQYAIAPLFDLNHAIYKPFPSSLKLKLKRDNIKLFRFPYLVYQTRPNTLRWVHLETAQNGYFNCDSRAITHLKIHDDHLYFYSKGAIKSIDLMSQKEKEVQDIDARFHSALLFFERHLAHQDGEGHLSLFPYTSPAQKVEISLDMPLSPSAQVYVLDSGEKIILDGLKWSYHGR